MQTLYSVSHTQCTTNIWHHAWFTTKTCLQRRSANEDFSDICEDSSAPAVKTYFVDLKYTYGIRSSDFSSSMTGFLGVPSTFFYVAHFSKPFCIPWVLNTMTPCPSVLLSLSSVSPLLCCQGNIACYDIITNGYPFTRLLIPNAVLGFQNPWHFILRVKVSSLTDVCIVRLEALSVVIFALFP